MGRQKLSSPLGAADSRNWGGGGRGAKTIHSCPLKKLCSFLRHLVGNSLSFLMGQLALSLDAVLWWSSSLPPLCWSSWSLLKIGLPLPPDDTTWARESKCYLLSDQVYRSTSQGHWSLGQTLLPADTTRAWQGPVAIWLRLENTAIKVSCSVGSLFHSLCGGGIG